MTSAVDPDGGTEADQYDPAGNRTAITATTALATMTTNYRYDAADQLTTSGTAGTDSQGHHIYGPILGYGYDGQGDRLRSYEQGTPTWTLRNDAQDLVGGLASLVSDGQADYTYLNPGAGQAPLAGYTQSTTRTTYLGSDLLGSVRLATDPTGAVIGSGGYDAWGNARPYQGTSGPTLLAGLQGSSPFGYAGQYADAGPGTYAMRARTYNPGQGRFETEDLATPQLRQSITLNPYAYGWDNPSNNADPSGLSPSIIVSHPCGSDIHDTAVGLALAVYVALHPSHLAVAGCNVGIPLATGRNEFVKATTALRSKDQYLFEQIISNIESGVVGAGIFPNATAQSRCRYVPFSTRVSWSYASAKHTKADLVFDIGGGGDDPGLYEIEPWDVKNSSITGELESWYYVDAARTFDLGSWRRKFPFYPNPTTNAQTLQGTKTLGWTEPKVYLLGSTFPLLVPGIKVDGSTYVLGTITDIDHLILGDSALLTVFGPPGWLWFIEYKDNRSWEEELVAKLGLASSSVNALKLKVNLWDLVDSERRQGQIPLIVYPPGGGVRLLPPQADSCGPLDCIWVMLEHHEEEVWAGVTHGKITALGGCVLDPVCSVRLGGFLTLSAAALGWVAIQEAINPSPVGYAAAELGVKRYRTV